MSSKFRFEDEEVAGSGVNFIGVAGETLGNRKAVRIGTNGRLYLADASAVGTLPAIGITLASATTGQNILVLLKGFAYNGDGPWTAGSRLYVTDTAGEIAHAAGTVTQEIGVAYSTTQIWVDPHGLDTGGAGAATREFFYGAPNIDVAVGDHGGQTMADGIGTYIRRDIFIPNDFTTITRCDILVVQSTGANPNLVWSCTTDWGQICAGEDYLANSDNTLGTTAMPQDDIVCLEISAALTGIAAGDLVGVSFYRDGANVADTVGGNVYYLGIRLRYT